MGERNDRRQLGANARLIAVSTIVLRDQAPEHAVQFREPGIGRIEDILDVIEEPLAQILKRARIAQVPADQAFELMCERRHDASL